jgi:glycosyltransferase involved in cell wall biosynthesis
MTADLTGIRVVIANNFPGPGLGGGEVLLLTLVRGLIAAGAEVRAVVVPDSGFGAQAAAAGALVDEGPMTVTEASVAIRMIAEQIAGDGPVVLLGTGYWTNLLTRQAARGTGARLVNFLGAIPGASVADGGSRVGLAVRRFADRATASRVDAYVAVAAAAAAALIADGAPAERVHTIPNGIDVDALRAQAGEPVPQLPAGRPLVVCAARLETVKGVEYLVRAAEDLPGATVAITGTGPLEESLREIAVTLGVADRVVFLGRVPYTAPVFAAADVVVLPSLSEGLPTVALEAMALARPVVATCVGGTPEAVQDGVTGLLVEPCDPAALAGAIKRLADDPQLARALGEAGAARVEERFTAAVMVDSYAALFADLVAAPPR